MLDPVIYHKLESLRELPTIPYVISDVLHALDNPNISAARLAALIERDQTLTLRVLRVANSPFYGFARKISTIDLAIVVLGLNSIKEIVLSLVVQRLFSKIKKDVFDISSFWRYSVFCGACSRLLARKLGYRLAGEAFVGGLMHDIGILIFIEYFTERFIKARGLQFENDLSYVEAELAEFNSSHCDIGGWLSEKWNLPSQLCSAIKNHHSHYNEIRENNDVSDELATNIKSQGKNPDSLLGFDEPLTAIVAMSEWFASEMGFKDWAEEIKPPDLYLANEVLNEIKSDDVLHPDSVINVLKQEIMQEYQRASVLAELPAKPLY